MFLTHKAWMSPIHNSLSSSGELFWSCVELSLNSPWFLVTVNQYDGLKESRNIEFRRSFMVAKAEDLMKFFIENGNNQIELESVTLIIPKDDDDLKAWSAQQVKAFWDANDPETPGFRVNICETITGEKHVTTFGAPPIDRLTNLTLKYKLRQHEAN